MLLVNIWFFSFFFSSFLFSETLLILFLLSKPNEKDNGGFDTPLSFVNNPPSLTWIEGNKVIDSFFSSWLFFCVFSNIDFFLLSILFLDCSVFSFLSSFSLLLLSNNKIIGFLLESILLSLILLTNNNLVSFLLFLISSFLLLCSLLFILLKEKFKSGLIFVLIVCNIGFPSYLISVFFVCINNFFGFLYIENEFFLIFNLWYYFLFIIII